MESRRTGQTAPRVPLPDDRDSAPRRGGTEVGRRVACGFVVVSLLAAFAPMRRYVARLGRDDFVLWVAAVVWTLTLPIAFVMTLRLAHRWLDRRRGRARGEAEVPRRKPP
jgi:hypothetical protein